MSVSEDVGKNQGCYFHTLEIWNLSFISDPKMHTYFVENLTPIVLLLSWLNSLRVN